jgi:FlaA1/EpsC-like NDP-sugar epimerase
MHKISDILRRDEVLSRVEEIEEFNLTGKFVMLTAK